MSETANFKFWDVQHGHATYLNTPNDRHIVVDLGTGSYQDFNEEFSPLIHLKNKYSIDRIDYLVITHPHKDHIDDILNIDKVRPRTLRRPKNIDKDALLDAARDKDIPKYKKFFKLDNEYNADVAPRNKLSNPDNYGGMIIKGFSTTECSSSNLNNRSLIEVFEYEGSKVVVPGDNEPCSLNTLLKDDDFVSAIKNADVLLAPHHGRKSGFCKDFVKIVNPRLTIVSDGRFGDTSHTSAYSNLSRGWTVHKRSGGKEKRNVVTTRKDGVISVKLGRNSSGNPFVAVRVD